MAPLIGRKYVHPGVISIHLYSACSYLTLLPDACTPYLVVREQLGKILGPGAPGFQETGSWIGSRLSVWICNARLDGLPQCKETHHMRWNKGNCPLPSLVTCSPKQLFLNQSAKGRIPAPVGLYFRGAHDKEANLSLLYVSTIEVQKGWSWKNEVQAPPLPSHSIISLFVFLVYIVLLIFLVAMPLGLRGLC